MLLWGISTVPWLITFKYIWSIFIKTFQKQNWEKEYRECVTNKNLPNLPLANLGKFSKTHRLNGNKCFLSQNSIHKNKWTNPTSQLNNGKWSKVSKSRDPRGGGVEGKAMESALMLNFISKRGHRQVPFLFSPSANRRVNLVDVYLPKMLI